MAKKSSKKIDINKIAKLQKPKPSKQRKEGMVSGIVRYFREVRLELKKVTWPNRSEVVSSTTIVLAAILFFTVYIGLLDMLFVQLVKIFTFQF